MSRHQEDCPDAVSRSPGGRCPGRPIRRDAAPASLPGSVADHLEEGARRSPAGVGGAPFARHCRSVSAARSADLRRIVL